MECVERESGTVFYGPKKQSELPHSETKGMNFTPLMNVSLHCTVSLILMKLTFRWRLEISRHQIEISFYGFFVKGYRNQLHRGGQILAEKVGKEEIAGLFLGLFTFIINKDLSKILSIVKGKNEEKYKVGFCQTVLKNLKLA